MMRVKVKEAFQWRMIRRMKGRVGRNGESESEGSISGEDDWENKGEGRMMGVKVKEAFWWRMIGRMKGREGMIKVKVKEVFQWRMIGRIKGREGRNGESESDRGISLKNDWENIGEGRKG